MKSYGNWSFSIDTSALAYSANDSDVISTLSLVLLPASYDYRDQWFHLYREQYMDLKEQLAEKLIEKAETLIPGLTSNIVEKDIITPETCIKNLLLTSAKSIKGPGIPAAIYAGLYTADTIIEKSLTNDRSEIKQ